MIFLILTFSSFFRSWITDPGYLKFSLNHEADKIELLEYSNDEHCQSLAERNLEILLDEEAKNEPLPNATDHIMERARVNESADEESKHHNSSQNISSNSIDKNTDNSLNGTFSKLNHILNHKK